MQSLPLLFLLVSCAQESKGTRPTETIRYQEFAGIIEDIAKDVLKNEKALVVWLVDNGKMLKASNHGEMLAGEIRRCFRKGKVQHAVMAFGEHPQLVSKLTDDPDRAAAAIEFLANGSPDDAIKNCMEAVRQAARAVSGASGTREYVVLFTQENGDSEDDIESTLKFLKSGGVVFLPIAPEAVYSDPYWESAYGGMIHASAMMDRIRKLPFQLRGPESAFVEFPYGWPFTWVDPGYTVPSGFGYWGLSRLAAQTGGKSYLYDVNRSPLSFCQRYACRICTGQHKGCDAAYDVTKLQLTDPDLGSRVEYGARYGKDKLYLTILDAWDKLHKEGLLRGVPPLRATGGGLTENRRGDKKPGLNLAGSALQGTDWRANAQGAIRWALLAEREARELLAAAEKPAKDADKRVIATAEALGINLLLLSQSCRQFAAFCEEMSRARAHKGGGDGVASPGIDIPPGQKVVGFVYEDVFLCHGGAALKDIRFLGNLKGLHEALDKADQMIDKHRGTPWEVLMRRAYVPVFEPLCEEKETEAGGGRPRPSARSTSTGAQEGTPGTPARPPRPDRGGTGGSSGTGTRTGGGNP